MGMAGRPCSVQSLSCSDATLSKSPTFPEV